MPRRPFFNFTGVQISQIFADNKNDLDMLKQVLAELQYRSTPIMKTLRVKVERRIGELTSSAGRTKTEPHKKNDQLKHTVHQSQPSKPVQQRLFDDEKNCMPRRKIPLNQPPLKQRRQTKRQRKSLSANRAWGKCGSPASWTEFRPSGSLTLRTMSN
jgi:hypothetical protein